MEGMVEGWGVGKERVGVERGQVGEGWGQGEGTGKEGGREGQGAGMAKRRGGMVKGGRGLGEGEMGLEVRGEEEAGREVRGVAGRGMEGQVERGRAAEAKGVAVERAVEMAVEERWGVGIRAGAMARQVGKAGWAREAAGRGREAGQEGWGAVGKGRVAWVREGGGWVGAGGLGEARGLRRRRTGAQCSPHPLLSSMVYHIIIVQIIIVEYNDAITEIEMKMG